MDGRVVIAATDLPAEDVGREPRVFTYTVPSGELELEIFSPAEGAIKHFDGWGESLGTGPGTFFVGSEGSSVPAGQSEGRVDVYDVETGELVLQITDPWPPSPIPRAGNEFGRAIEAFGQDILVSDTSDFSTADYVGLFDGTTGELLHEFERPGDPNAEKQFGWSIAATDELILISDPQAEVNGVPGAGTIFVYEGLPEPDLPFYGDANLDGIVDAADLNIVGNNWLHEDVSEWSEGDFNGDHRVDQIDLNLLGENWLAVKSPTATAVPEPSSIVLFLMFLVSLFCRDTLRSIRGLAN